MNKTPAEESAKLMPGITQELNNDDIAAFTRDKNGLSTLAE